MNKKFVLNAENNSTQMIVPLLVASHNVVTSLNEISEYTIINKCLETKFIIQIAIKFNLNNNKQKWRIVLTPVAYKSVDL